MGQIISKGFNATRMDMQKSSAHLYQTLMGSHRSGQFGSMEWGWQVAHLGQRWQVRQALGARNRRSLADIGWLPEGRQVCWHQAAVDANSFEILLFLAAKGWSKFGKGTLKEYLRLIKTSLTSLWTNGHGGPIRWPSASIALNSICVKLGAMMRMQRNIQHQSKSWFGHTGSVKSVAYHPDISKARWIVSGGCDKTVRLWDLKEGRAEMVWERTEAVDSVNYGGVDHILWSGTKMETCMIGFRVKSSNIMDTESKVFVRCIEPWSRAQCNRQTMVWTLHCLRRCQRIPRIRARGRGHFVWSPDEGFIAAALRVSLCHPNWAAFSAGGTNRAVWAKEGLQHLGNLEGALMLKALFSPHCSRCVCLHFFVVLAGDVPMSMWPLVWQSRLARSHVLAGMQ